MALVWSEIVRQAAFSLAATTMPEVQNVPVQHVLQHYRPTEHPTWDRVREEYEDEHPVIMDSLRDDLAHKGVQTPIDAFRHHEGGWAIHNGHHRILTAHDVGLKHVPVRHWDNERDIPKSLYWDPESRTHYGPDEDPDGEGQPRY